eukprot:7062858-Prymnesium_polylepis.1
MAPDVDACGRSAAIADFDFSAPIPTECAGGYSEGAPSRRGGFLPKPCRPSGTNFLKDPLGEFG